MRDLEGRYVNCCSLRYGLSFFIHFCNIAIAAQRVCLSLTMVVMVNTTYSHELHNSSTNELLTNVKNPVYDWSPETQGLILSSIFYGAAIIQLPSGYLSGIYSIKKIVGCGLFLSSLCSLLIPLAAAFGKTSVIVCRVVQGIAQGMASTGQHEIWTKWAPPRERGRLTSICLSGFLLGSFIVLLVTGFICESLGWPIVFYIFSAYGGVLCLLWFVLVYDDPKDHPCISISEKQYITSSLVQQFSSSQQSLPIKSMLKSLPIWAISFATFGYFWSNTILFLYIPMYINSILHVNIKENGLLSALPFLFAWICGILSGQMADFFSSRSILSTTNIRKLFTTLGLLLPVLFSMCLLYLSSSYFSTVIFLILASATGAFSLPGMMINALDIAPRYYGFLKGVTILVGMIGGLISSTLTGIIINQDPESPWFEVFFLMTAVCLACLIFYLIFGEGEIQEWAKERKHTRL
ncbi:PREDICTED: sodium-dependent phosphate transport protein 1 [Elephantulus edwardii]|uniref:sodium-dependent phosphate transport protein 1 n=1 Tax=Elephantulus edwardii TaxID=28737 RepID=UPI0003F0589C|nr:PREDICTED: sodium-dependent phosphate transport protein 1 [Elephantulus edwardii]